METEQPFPQNDLNTNFISNFEKVEIFTGSIQIFPAHLTP